MIHKRLKVTAVGILRKREAGDEAKELNEVTWFITMPSGMTGSFMET